MAEPAGKLSERYKEEHDFVQSCNRNKRTFVTSDEVTRSIQMKDNLSRFDQSYKRVYNSNLWNEQSRLSSKFKIYNMQDHTFRKTHIDLQQVEQASKAD